MTHPYSTPTIKPWPDVLEYTDNWPKPGVRFVDFTPVLADPTHWQQLVDQLSDLVLADTHILGLEARGFVLAAAVADRTKRGLILARKAGKTPPPVNTVDYDLEYGQATLEIGRHRIHSNDRVLIMDDVLATGGTAKAAVELVRRAGATVSAVICALEIPELGGREALAALNVPVHTLFRL